MNISKRLITFLSVLMFSSYSLTSETEELDITPVCQQTEVWCWAAVLEMVFDFYDLPNINPAGNYQCGIVAVYYGPGTYCWNNCFSCITTIGSVSETQKVVDNYGRFARMLNFTSRDLNSNLQFNSLSFKKVKEEIDNGRPIIAGISPTGIALPNLSTHAVLIVGYEEDEDDEEYNRLIVNDPYPYNITNSSNPYSDDEQYDQGIYECQHIVNYKYFKNNLRWKNTIYKIR